MARMETRYLEKRVGLAVDDEGAMVFSGIGDKLAAQEETKIIIVSCGDGSGGRLAGRVLVHTMLHTVLALSLILPG